MRRVREILRLVKDAKIAVREVSRRLSSVARLARSASTIPTSAAPNIITEEIHVLTHPAVAIEWWTLHGPMLMIIGVTRYVSSPRRRCGCWSARPDSRGRASMAL